MDIIIIKAKELKIGDNIIILPGITLETVKSVEHTISNGRNYSKILIVCKSGNEYLYMRGTDVYITS